MTGNKPWQHLNSNLSTAFDMAMNQKMLSPNGLLRRRPVKMWRRESGKRFADTSRSTLPTITETPIMRHLQALNNRNTSDFYSITDFDVESDQSRLRAMSPDYQSKLFRDREVSGRRERDEPSNLDIEKEIVVHMQPKSRRLVKLEITGVKRAEPQVVFDSPAPEHQFNI